METDILKKIIEVIRTEEKWREHLLTDEDPDFAYDHWLFTDKPFIRELCLMLLVTLRHYIERELVGLAALAADDGKEITYKQYQDKEEKLRKGRGWDWNEIKKRLRLKDFEEYKQMEALRLLANSYKHDPNMGPDRELLQWFEINTESKYLPLPESDSLWKGLAVIIGLSEGATHCDIAERFVDIASNYLVSVQSNIELSRIERTPASLRPKDFAT